MLRSVLFVTLFASLPATAASLVVDDGLLRGAAETLMDHQAMAPTPLLEIPHSGMTGDVVVASGGGGDVGVGLQLGAPSALTVKFGGLGQSGIVLGIGAGFGYGRNFGAALWLHGDYLMTLATLVRADALNLNFYAGPGLFATVFGVGYGFGYAGEPYYKDGNFIGAGIRFPLGLSMAFNDAPIEIYVELDPALSLFPGLGFGIGGSLGFRWYI